MQVSSTSTLSLAGRLRALGDADLVELLTARGIVREAGIRDFFDLADALLDGASIASALTKLDRPTLAALAALEEVSDASGATSAQLAKHLGQKAPDVTAVLTLARGLALVDTVDDRWVAYSPVTEQLATWPTQGLPTAQELASSPPPAGLEPVSASDVRFIDSVAAELAFATTTSIAQLIAELRHDPARELARGGIALPDSKRLAATMSVELDQVPALVSIAARADLIALDGGSWLPAVASTEWMLGSTADRWSHLAGAWFDHLPADIRQLLSSRSHSTWGARLRDYLDWLYPAGGQWMDDRSGVVTRDAELLGITANAAPSTPGSTLLADGAAAATAAMAVLFPPEVDKVYVQQDLTIVSPGPLKPRLDARLRVIADVESRALAATYRVTESSINRALAAGETANSVREFLAGISLTGIPQPLSYLIAATAERYGKLRVGVISAADTAATASAAAHTHDDLGVDAHSYVWSDDTTLIGTLLVDQNLAPLSLRRVSPNRAVSRYPSDVVFWSLNEARYPVAAEDAERRVIQLERNTVARVVPPQTVPVAVTIVQKLRLAGEPTTVETDKAWLERQIEAAIKGRQGLTVTVQMPDGSTTDFQLEPTGLGGGRLRARDRKSDIERTLPLSRVVGIAPPERP
ncbi:helicase-associated domain-containing protein [Glaciihabitans sp. dw_435]|uniref:helicase-associated domain-containing protein n=1 Tax=Glaciihabitans sp. dw_435 TaxID=2720081 RepID=UPI001BD3A492|nr:helicase-associated domain-containing protein [Glaciihabitans sp. dw_435]